MAEGVHPSNGPRLVAVWNACSGIPTEELEKRGVGWLHTAVEEILLD